MQSGKFRPGHRKHFRGRIQLHRARTQWNHGVRQGEVARLKPMEVTEQLMLGMIPVEHFVGKVGSRPGKVCGVRRPDGVTQFLYRQRQSLMPDEYFPQAPDITFLGRFIK